MNGNRDGSPVLAQVYFFYIHSSSTTEEQTEGYEYNANTVELPHKPSSLSVSHVYFIIFIPVDCL